MRYDLHIHTRNSACSILKPETILKIARRVGLDGIAICDHNTIKGGVEVSKANKDKDLEVIPGVEVNTDKGHVLGLYVNEEIRTKVFFEVCDEIRKQGGITIVAHPFRMLPMLRSRLKGIDLKKYLDGVEAYNARTSYFGNRAAEGFAKEFNMAETGGSDAHFSFEIGRSVTLFDGDLEGAIKKKITRASGSNITGIVGSTFSFINKNIMRRW